LQQTHETKKRRVGIQKAWTKGREKDSLGLGENKMMAMERDRLMVKERERKKERKNNG
jgi:hypothetical protein